MIDTLQRAIATLMNRVRVNDTRERVDDGVPVFVKRRRFGGSLVIWFGNQFLTLARSGVHMFVRPRDWVDWEIRCARLLYPERRAVKAGPSASVILPKVNGNSLRRLMQRNEATPEAFIAAARELRRVHQLPCSHFNGQWSHGDLHLDNIVYDPMTGRAVLIDFDTRHVAGQGARQRHADDLKVILLELVGLPEEQWRQAATALIQEYGEPSVLEELGRQLVVPHGFARILWHTRTGGAPTRLVERRLNDVRTIIQRVVTSTGAVSQRETGTRNCLQDG